MGVFHDSLFNTTTARIKHDVEIIRRCRIREIRELIKEFIKDLDPECDHDLIEKWSEKLNE